jgi:hypothetical protein
MMNMKMRSPMSRSENIKRLLNTALKKEARMTLSDGSEIHIQINEDRGDFVYILKLENLDEDGNQITNSNGTPIYNWYVGESKNAASRWVQHKMGFYIDKIKEEAQDSYLLDEDLVQESKAKDIKDLSEMTLTSCGANWTLKHRPIEAVFVQGVNSKWKDMHSAARVILRKGIERAVTEAMFQAFGTDTVQGGPWCRGPESIRKERKEEHLSVDPSGEFESGDILNRLKSIDGIIENNKSLAKSITDITSDINNITERDIRTLKSKTISKIKRRANGGYSSSTGSYSESLEKFIEKVNDKFPQGLKDENGKHYKNIKVFLSEVLFDTVTNDSAWSKAGAGLDWGQATPLIIDRLAKLLEANGFDNLDSLEYISPSSSKWTSWLDKHDCIYMQQIRDWRRAKNIEKYEYLKEQYESGLGHFDKKTNKYKNLDKIVQNQPTRSSESYLSGTGVYFYDTKAVRDALKKLLKPGTVLYKERFAKNGIIPWLCEGKEYTIPAITSDEIVGDYQELERRHLEGMEALDEELSLEDKQLLDKDEKISIKYDRMKSLFSKENIYGLCLEGEGAGSLTLTALHQDNNDIFIDRSDFAFYFFKYIKDAYSKLGKALLATTTEDYYNLMRSPPFGEWRKYDTYGDTRIESKYRGRWKGQVGVITRIVNNMLNFLNTKKRELIRMPFNNSDMYIQNIKDDKFFSILLDDEDISNFYTSKCVGMRFSRIEKFLRPITVEVSEEEEETQDLFVDEKTASELLRWMELQKFAIKTR